MAEVGWDTGDIHESYIDAEPEQDDTVNIFDAIEAGKSPVNFGDDAEALTVDTNSSESSTERDTYVVDDRSFRNTNIHIWAFDRLLQYHNEGVVDAPLKVYSISPSYYQLLDRKLETTSVDELMQKAFIIDRSRSKEYDLSLETDFRVSPSYLNFTGFKQGVQILHDFHSNGAKMGYVGGNWRRFAKNNQKHKKRRLQQLQMTSIHSSKNENEEYTDDALEEENLNPARIKVWAFYLLTGDYLTKAEQLCSTRAMRRKAAIDTRMATKDLPMLCIVIPSDYTPVSLQHALQLSSALGGGLGH